MLYYFFLTGKNPSAGSLANFVSSFTSFGKNIDSIKKTTDFVLEMFQKILDFACRQVFGVPSPLLVNDDNNVIAAYVKDCQLLFDDSFLGKLSIDRANADRVYNLWSRGNDILTKLGDSKTIGSIRTRLTMVINEVAKLKTKFDGSKYNASGVRQVPLCTLIVGASDVGKSYLTNPLVSCFLALVLTDEEVEILKKDIAPFVYSRVNEHKYWDGYYGQFSVIFDDFGQLRDQVGMTENEYMDLIRTKNIFGYVLHMAGIESKGNNDFRSKAIFATTNLVHFSPESIVSTEALERRFDVVAHHIPPVKYCHDHTIDGPLLGRRLDQRKLPRGVDICTDAVEYHLYDLKTRSYTGVVMNFTEFVHHLAKLYRKGAGEFVDYKTGLGKLTSDFTQYRAQMDLSCLTFDQLMALPDQSGVTTPSTVYSQKERDDLEEIAHSISDDLFGYTLSYDAFVDRIREVFPESSEGIEIRPFESMKKFMLKIVCNVHLRAKFVSGKVLIVSQKLYDGFKSVCSTAFESITSFFKETWLQLSNYPTLRSILSLDNLYGLVFAYIVREAIKYAVRFIGETSYSFLMSMLRFLGLTQSSESQFESGTASRGAKHDQQSIKKIMSKYKANKVAMQPQVGIPRVDTTNVQIMSKVRLNQYEMIFANGTSRAGLVTFVRGRIAKLPIH
jgi:hypothetical protein